MKTLLVYLNEVSKERGFRDFRHCTDDGRVYVVEDIIKTAGERYVHEMINRRMKNIRLKIDDEIMHMKCISSPIHEDCGTPIFALTVGKNYTVTKIGEADYIVKDDNGKTETFFDPFVIFEKI